MGNVDEEKAGNLERIAEGRVGIGFTTWFSELAKEIEDRKRARSALISDVIASIEASDLSAETKKTAAELLMSVGY